MFEDEDHCSFGRPTRRAGPRLFLNANDDNERNLAAWKGAVLAARSGDARLIMGALNEARGSFLPLNARGTPARSPVAKAILALKEDPQAWRRLREACGRSGLLDENPAQEKKEWQPSCVDILDYLWAANPEGLALAAVAWRKECLTHSTWWDCPFLARPYEGPIDLRRALKSAVSRHFRAKEMQEEATARGSTLAKDPLGNDGTERTALARILTETALACVDQLWAHEEQARQLRLEGQTVWPRGGFEWGIRWFGADVNVESDPSAPPKTPVALSGAQAVQEGAALGPSQATLACRKMMLAVVERAAPRVAAAPALRSWLDAYPNAAEGLPLRGSDWMPAATLFSICDAAGASDDALGRWLAAAGAAWSSPAGFDHRERLVPDLPFWSSNRSSLKATDQTRQWGPLEWALMTRPEAARRACLLGAKLAPGVEETLAASAAGDSARSIDLSQAMAWAEACRLAQASVSVRTSAPSKRSMAL
jgi:hypothetical protein